MANNQTITAASAADAYVVVSWWQDRSNPKTGTYEYEHRDSLNEAADLYTEYEAGEHRRATAIGIFPAQNGMPCGEKLGPVTVSRLVRETLAA